jgi:hypothetical protein
MTRLSKKNGWFVRVGKVLDHLLEVQGHHELTAVERRRLEAKWLWDKIHSGGRSTLSRFFMLQGADNSDK